MEAVLAVIGQLQGSASAVQDPTPVLSEAVRASHLFPLESGASSSLSHSYIARQYPEFQDRMAAQQLRVRALLERLVRSVEPSAAAHAIASSLSEGGEGDHTNLFDFLDRLREGAESYIDESRGLNNAQPTHAAAGAGSAGGASASSKAAAVSAPIRRIPLTSSKVDSKPQLKFSDAIDNTRETPFHPKLREKYHALVDRIPSPEGSGTRIQLSGLTPIAYRGQPGIHPYARELDALAYLPAQVEVVPEPRPFSSLDDTSVEFVNTPAALMDLCNFLEGVGVHDASSSSSSSTSGEGEREERLPRDAATDAAPVAAIAIDLEAHTVRSFQGFCCLMQLSTRTRDYLVDAMVLRSHMHVLNRVFTNPAIVKVLHGCDGDVAWLQRDFGLYLVNVFDTGQAARALRYPSFGLAHLLHTFCGVTANKEYQTADWRERPIPPVMLKYAREDTHYLLGIYDRLKNELIASSRDSTPLPLVVSVSPTSGVILEAPVHVPDLLATVLNRSRDLAMQVYSKEHYTPSAYKRVMQRSDGQRGSTSGGTSAGAWAIPAPTSTGGANGGEAAPSEEADTFSPRTRVFAALYEWRDAIGRREDESTGFVLANRLLSRLAEHMPTNVNALSQCLHPMPPLVRLHASAIVELVAQALRSNTVPGVTQSGEEASETAAPPRSPASSATPAAPTATAAVHVSAPVAGHKRPAAERPAPAVGEGDVSAPTQAKRLRTFADSALGASPSSVSVGSHFGAFGSGARWTSVAAPASSSKHSFASAAVVASVADVFMEDLCISSPPSTPGGGSSDKETQRVDGDEGDGGVSTRQRLGHVMAGIRQSMTGKTWYQLTGVADYFDAAVAPTAPTATASNPEPGVAQQPSDTASLHTVAATDSQVSEPEPTGEAEGTEGRDVDKEEGESGQILSLAQRYRKQKPAVSKSSGSSSGHHDGIPHTGASAVSAGGSPPPHTSFDYEGAVAGMASMANAKGALLHAAARVVRPSGSAARGRGGARGGRGGGRGKANPYLGNR